MSTKMAGDRPSPVRERLLASAGRQFYETGIQATSADRIIADVQTTKATFYRHFATKDDLVLAYLDHEAAGERQEMQEAADTPDAHEAVHAVVHVLGASTCEEGFRGCPFINAAAEYPDADHRVRAFIRTHRSWWFDFFTELAERRGVSSESSKAVAGQLMMLRDGAMLGGYVDDPRDIEAWLAAAFDAVLTSAGAASPATGH